MCAHTREVSCFSGVSAISTDFRYNERIRISPVRLINDKEEMLGIIPTAEAMRLAREAGLDLVEVAPNARPPVCKILDFGKWKYQQQKKEQKAQSHSKGGVLKELKMRTVRIGDHDLEIKINHAKAFLAEGNKVQFTLQFRGRELAHVDLGYNIFNKIRDALFYVSKVDRGAKMEGKRMTMMLQPDHKPANTPLPVANKSPGAFNRQPVGGQGMNIQRPVGSPVGAPAAAPSSAPTGAPTGTPTGAPSAAPLVPGVVTPTKVPSAQPAPSAQPVPSAQPPRPVPRRPEPAAARG